MSKKVLVADATPHIARLIEVNLQRQGYEVVTALDARTVIATAKAEKPDLVVVDSEMSEVIVALRSDPLTESIKVLVLPARV